MEKYCLSFDVVMSVTYEVEADSEDSAIGRAESINAQDVFDGSVDGLEWQWDNVISDTISITRLED